MKSKKVLSLLLSIAVLGSTLPTAALAVDDTATTGDKTVPGWVDENDGHPKQIQETFDFVQNNIAYSIVDGGVEVSPWYWKWEPHQCDKGHVEYVPCGSEYSNQNISIPVTVEYNSTTYNVVGIGDSAFWNATGYTVSFPNSEYFTYIGDQVFFQTSPNMESITIPASVTHIGKKSFALNEDSIPVTIPEDSKLEVIGDQAFANNSAITALDLPDTLTTIGSQAFSNCTSLTSISIPKSVTSIETDTFDNYYQVDAQGADNVTFEEGCIFKIQDGVLYDDEWLIRVLDWQEEVVVPDGIKYIGADAFNAYSTSTPNEMNTLKSITFPESLVSIGNTAFRACKALETVIIPENVTELGTGAFSGCTGLKTVAIQGSITELNQTFNGCSALETATLPDTIEVIGEYTFNGCKKLDLDALPSNLRELGQYAFNECESLTKAVVPSGVTEIPEMAFTGCLSLEQIVLPDGITSIGDYAFDLTKDDGSGNYVNNDPKLASVNIPSTVTSLGENFLGGIKANGETKLISQVADPSIFNESALAGISGDNKPTLIYPEEYKDAYEDENSPVGDLIPSDGSGSELKYSLSIPATASVYTGNTTTLAVTSTIPTGATLEVTSSNGAATASLSGDNRTITVTGVSDGTATITVAMKLNGTTLTSKSCTVTVTTYNPPSGGGGGSSDPTYSISLPGKVTGGEVSIQKRYAEKGETVTITVTPDDGYELDELIVTDSKGNKLDLTDKGNGKFTFKMPAGRVEIEVSFQEIVIEPGNPFVDVSTSDYYYDAVLWAVENGVTNGTSATTFGPNMAVSRAQMVTFLWRAHGSPKATGTNPFTDVSTSDYYYDAVLWAVANGVTNGTSATTFSPDTAVTRSQAVTFQWRAAGSPVVSGSSFGDVATDAYYVNAVTWAVANGITNGTGGNTFSPDVVVSRAQAVTFLYREQE